MDSYGQFCPVARASEVLTRRWTPLVIRELLCGSTRFNELRRGIPRISPSMLSRRLDELEHAGVVERHHDGDRSEYRLTPAGEELAPVVEAMGVWGRRWIRDDLTGGQLDANVLMWDVRRRLDTDRAPDGRTVVAFRFPEQPRDRRNYWLIVEGGGDVDLCRRDPGYEVDLEVEANLRAMTGVWVGDHRFREMLKRHEVILRGPTSLRRSFPEWLQLSPFADIALPDRAEQ